MIKMVVVNRSQRKLCYLSKCSTPREAFEVAGIELNGTVLVDGEQLTESELDMTFEELDVSGKTEVLKELALFNHRMYCAAD